MKELQQKCMDAFYRCFGETTWVRCFFAPGRVNLIGEHTDYNGGHVFPCALTLGTCAAVRKREDRTFRFCSLNDASESVIVSSLDEMHPLSDDGWPAYMKGVIWAFAKRGMCMDCGFDVVICGDLPAGAGLSSSASLEVLTGYLLRDLYGFAVTDTDLARIGQEAENDYVGVNCGIMDQFASAMGRKDHAIFLDTSTLDYTYVSLKMENLVLIVSNTNKKHSLQESAYNDRRRECAEALKILQQTESINSLGELTPDRFAVLSSLLADPVLRKRAAHAVTENQRTIDAVKVLQEGRMDEFGKLMNASHVSLRDNYEVSCRELDILAETAWGVPGVLGSRMTGGGFGGCTVSLVEKSAVEDFRRIVGETYQAKVGYACSFYEVSAGNGPVSLQLDQGE